MKNTFFSLSMLRISFLSCILASSTLPAGENVPLGGPDAERARVFKKITDRYLQNYVRAWKAESKEESNWAPGISPDDRLELAIGIEGYYRWRFMVRQDELKTILLRANMEAKHKREKLVTATDVKKWQQLRKELEEADAIRAFYVDTFGRQVQALLDEYEERFLAIVADELGIPWGTPLQDPASIQSEARKPLSPVIQASMSEQP
jgi:hypothetical protein